MAVTIVRTASSSQIGSLLSQAAASATYLTQVSASTIYAPITPVTQTGFRNLLINGDFRINQRAFTYVASDGIPEYNFDRWFIISGALNSSVTPQTFSLGNVIPGYESSNFLRLTTPSTTKADMYDAIGQRIEDVRNLAGQTATISFWAKSGSATPNITVELIQNFGSGGSPSANVNIYVNKIALSTSWTRYTMTIAVPSISGKTIGTTANTSYLELRVWGSAGSNFNARTNSLGNQNNTFDFWGFQIERGSIATPFEQRYIGLELAMCQRYFVRLVDPSGTGVSNGGTANGATRVTVSLPVEMRIVPTSLTASGTFNFWDGTNAPTGTLASTSFFFGSKASIEVEFNLSSAITAGKAVKMYTSNSTSKWLNVSSEL
jgi:hypothetical protein